MSTSQPTRLVRGHAGRALRQIAGSTILPAKTIGTAGEQFFAYRALEEGLHVAQPLGDNLPYDLLVDTGKNIHRIQVKTSITEDVENAEKISTPSIQLLFEARR